MMLNLHFTSILFSSHKYKVAMIFLWPLLAITLVAFPSEACWGTPPPECPIGGETSTGVTCITSNNVVEIVPKVENVLECSKY